MRICRKCQSCIVDSEPVELAITSGTGWSANTVKHTLCQDCKSMLDQWFLPSAHQTHQSGPGESLADTAVASMALM